MRRSVVAAVALVLGGCGAPTGAPAPVVAPASPPAASPAPDDRPVAGPDAPVHAPIVSDWVDAEPVALAGGASVAPCPGDALMLCVTRDGADLGILELATFEAPAELAAADRPSLDAALRSWAAEHLAWVEDDRRAGCGDDHAVVRTRPATVTLGGVPGVRTGFEVHLDGVLVEKVVTWVTVREDTLVIVGADGARTGSCMAGGDLVLWQPEALVEHLDELDRVVAGTPLPG